MNFAIVINCIDGRVQLPVINFLKERFKVAYIDTITEPGPNKILAEKTNNGLINSIHNRIKLSIKNHNSKKIAVVAHHDCAGNQVDKEQQLEHLRTAVRLVRIEHRDLEVIGLWVDEYHQVSEVVS